MTVSQSVSLAWAGFGEWDQLWPHSPQANEIKVYGEKGGHKSEALPCLCSPWSETVLDASLCLCPWPGGRQSTITPRAQNFPPPRNYCCSPHLPATISSTDNFRKLSKQCPKSSRCYWNFRQFQKSLIIVVSPQLIRSNRLLLNLQRMDWLKWLKKVKTLISTSTEQ